MFEHLKHSRRLKELEERFEKMQHDFALLQLEWNDVFDKMRHITGRLAKRAALAQEKEDLLMGSPPARQDDAPGRSGPAALPGKAQIIQEQILARRRAVNGGGQ